MKKERNMITISDSGVVTVPDNIKMTIGEIAELFGIYYQTTKKCIRTIEKSAIAEGNNTLSCTVEGMTVYPDYYGLEMIVAVAFRVQSKNAAVFRNYLMRKLTKVEIPEILVMTIQNPALN